METIRCIISGIPESILSDIILGTAQQDPGIKVVGQINDEQELKIALAQQSIDVLILGLKHNCLPGSFRKILSEFPDLLIIGLSDDGRLASIYIENADPQGFIKVIRTFVKTLTQIDNKVMDALLK